MQTCINNNKQSNQSTYITIGNSSSILKPYRTVGFVIPCISGFSKKSLLG